MNCDVLIVGGGTGGVAAALALSGKGLSVVVSEVTDWVGGQLTSQIVPADEHPWIEQFGRTARYASQRRVWRKAFLDRTRGQLRQDTSVTNPGGGWVSRICMEPKDILGVLTSSLNAVPELTCLLRHAPVIVEVVDNRVQAVNLFNIDSGESVWVEPRFVLDATELGDLLPLTNTAYVVGAESKAETGEPHAVDGPAEPENIQSFTWCAAVGFDPNDNHTIEKPDQYDSWRSYVPPHWTGNLLDLTFPNVRTGAPMTLPLFSSETEALTLFGYRQIIDPHFYAEPTEAATVMNWPQNDYMLGHVIDVDNDVARHHYKAARELTLSVLYWLQSEHGLTGLRLRPDITGTPDGLAKAPYHRESRRIKSLRTVTELDVSPDCNPGCSVAPDMWDSVGVGAYRIDLHPATNGAKTIDISSLPFQIPLGALIPQITKNLLPACKNIGSTHITNGCYRLHPVEWNIGESAGLFAFFCLSKEMSPQDVYSEKTRVAEFQELLVREGIELAWPKLGPL